MPLFGSGRPDAPNQIHSALAYPLPGQTQHERVELRGIGLEIVRQLSRTGLMAVLASRDVAKGRRTREDVDAAFAAAIARRRLPAEDDADRDRDEQREARRGARVRQDPRVHIGAPELRDDVYALGCVVYELFTGRHPFDRKTAVQAQQVVIQDSRNADATWMYAGILPRRSEFRGVCIVMLPSFHQ